jgi:hypothetical protein
LFGLLALGLAAVGLYGVMSHAVAQRRREIGIRMALGAERSSVLWQVLRQVLVLAVTGVLIGLPAALGAGRLIESLLFGLAPRELATLGAAPSVLIGVANVGGLCAGDAGDARRSGGGLERRVTVFADLRYAFRVMSRTPSFAVAVVSVLAVGIGANTAIFSIVNAVLLRPLPFEQPERLVRIHTVPPGGTPDDLSPGKFYDWQRTAQSFDGMAMYQCCGLKEFALTGTGTARTVRGDSRERRLFRGRQSAAGTRTRFSARGGHAGRQAGGHPERPVLEG